MKNGKPLKGIVSVKIRDELGDQKRLSTSSWSVGPKRGEVANSMVGSVHVILVQEAETHFHDVTSNAKQLMCIYQGAGELTLCNKSTF